MQILYRLFIFSFVFFYSYAGHAVLDIHITRGVQQPLSIAVPPFDWHHAEQSPPLELANIITQDLSSSGHFDVLDKRYLPQQVHDLEAVNFSDWRGLGVAYLLVGSLRLVEQGDYQVVFNLVDISLQQQVLGFQIHARPGQLRKTAHKIADRVFQQLTGIKGIFSTHITYITARKKGPSSVYTLQVSDADGHNAKVLLESTEPLLSPAWSPDGRRLAYVSLEGRRSAIYIQDIISGHRELASSTDDGLNSAPAWSPDGGRLALSLSKAGNPDIYILDLDSRRWQRLTKHPAIDTEPAWSPDGHFLVFTSNRGGSPQIYRLALDQGAIKRLTFEGDYNAAPDYSPDGHSLVMMHGSRGQYHIATLDLQTKYLSLLTESGLDESPSFAPNGNMIIYTTTGAQGTQLATISVDRRTRQHIGLSDGEVREPDWKGFID